MHHAPMVTPGEAEFPGLLAPCGDFFSLEPEDLKVNNFRTRSNTVTR